MSRVELLMRSRLAMGAILVVLTAALTGACGGGGTEEKVKGSEKTEIKIDEQAEKTEKKIEKEKVEEEKEKEKGGEGEPEEETEIEDGEVVGEEKEEGKK